MRSRLKLWNDSGTKRARIGDSSRDPLRSPQHLALTASGGTRSSLKGLHKRRWQGGILKNREGTESNQKWSGVNMIHAGCTDIHRSLSIPSPLVGEGGAERSSATGEGFSPPAQTSRLERTPHPALRATFSHKGRRKKGALLSAQFVFATLGGAAVVMNDVASSIAWPNGVGMVMRKGTRTRVPAIGTNAISIRRSVARYLMTGRSGI
jgi:hypothetical protein